MMDVKTLGGLMRFSGTRFYPALHFQQYQMLQKRVLCGEAGDHKAGQPVEKAAFKDI